jgi:lipopolysaccharide export system permease protein
MPDSVQVPAGGIPGRSKPNFVARTRAMSSTIQNEIAQIDFTGKQINQYLVEIHKKYSIPAACIVFVLVGLPLGVMVRKGGFGVAASLSLGFFILYWACLIGGEKLADRGILSPMWGMWSANIIIGAFGVYLLVKTARETISVDFSSLTRVLPSRWRRQPEAGEAQA